MDKPLSFSSYKRYLTCPKMYHYNDVLGEKAGSLTSALFFGTLVGDAIEALLKGDTDSALDFYLEKMEAVRNTEIEFFVDDFDGDLVCLPYLEADAKSMGWKGDDYVTMIKDMLKDQANLSENQRKVLQSACWASLNMKAEYMIEGFEKWVLPKIAQVHDIQKHLITPEGDLHGYLDFTCTLTDGRKVLIDLKTSKMPYDSDAPLTSAQLALYAEIEDYEYAGFVVMSKTISKQKTKKCKDCGHIVKGGNAKSCTKKVKDRRCGGQFDIDMAPKSFVQLLVNKIPEINKALTVSAMRDTIKSIDAGNFPRNLAACNWMYGKKCVYFDKCWKGKK